MAYAPYTMLFTDQNPNREFIIQPETANGPATPTTGLDPTATAANTTLFLYGQGHPTYGDRIQEDLVYMLENFFNPVEPSFPIPGQIWAKSSANEITTPYQLYMYNPRKYVITASTTNSIYVQSDDGSETTATILARFQNLGLAKQFNVYDSTYDTLTFIQSAVPVISGSNVVLTVTPATGITNALVGQWTGGWEEIYQGNAQIILRRALNAGGYNLINLANPINAQDAATKAYVDLAVGGGTLTLASLADVAISTPQTGDVLTFNGLKWYNNALGSVYLPLAGGTMNGVINMGGSILTNLPLPTGIYDATNKQYVDNQPLSAANTSITAPNNFDILYYNSATALWTNSQPIGAGLVPISAGVTLTGALSMGGNVLTGLPTPINPTDAVNLSYVTAAIAGGAGGVLIAGTYEPTTGTLTLTNSGSFPPVTVTGFVPVSYAIPAPTTATNQFFALNAGQSTAALTTVTNALNQLDGALGNFIVPRQQLVFTAPGTRTAFDINNLTWAAPSFAPNKKYVKGSHNLAVYVNGIKQVSSTSGVAKLTSSIAVRDDFDINFTGGSCSVTVNGGAPVTATIGAQTTLGGVRNALNALALSYYINPIVSASGLQITVAGNVTAQFPVGTTFLINYSGTTNDGLSFTTNSASVYNSGPNTTTINIGTSLPATVNAGVIFQPNWGFSTSIESGSFVFHSNIPGSLSSISVTDTNLFSTITGNTYTFSFSGSPWTGSNSIAPATYGYNEIGMYGYQSSLFEFTTAPVSTDVVEVLIDREVVYNSTNPLASAIIG